LQERVHSKIRVRHIRPSTANGRITPYNERVIRLALEANDQPSADLLTQRLQIHEKTAWMLRSLLEV